MNFMALLKSKTFWTGLTAIAAGAFMIKKGDMETGIMTILGGLGLIFVRDAIAGK